jgi:hypothetical protein
MSLPRQQPGTVCTIETTKVFMIVQTNTTTPDPIYELIDDLKNHLHVILAANELGYVETALETWLSAKEVLQVIREALLTPRTMNADPYHDYDS